MLSQMIWVYLTWILSPITWILSPIIWILSPITWMLSPITSIFMHHTAPDMPSPRTQREALPQHPVDVFEYIVREPGPPSRLKFFDRGSVLYDYPSTGGVWISHPHPVLLQHLSIDRFTAIPSQCDFDPVAEDAFYASMKKIGATWWRSYYNSNIRVQSYPELQPDRVFVGWLKNGGVWFLKLND
jgi:hypothetical protein